MKLNWEKYAAYQLPDFPFGEIAAKLSIQEVEAGLEILKSNLSVRINKLQEFLLPTGIKLDGSEGNMAELNEFFSRHVERQPDANHMAFGWGEFCLDVGVYLGEILRDSHPSIEWDILERLDAEHPYFHDIGLKNSGEPYVVVPIFDTLFGYAQSVLEDDLLYEALRTTNFWLILSDTHAQMRGENPFP